jgi:hypothetical protein
VAERNVLRARQRNRAVFIEDQPGQRLAGFHAFDDDNGDRILGIVQHAVDHCGISRDKRPARNLTGGRTTDQLYHIDELNHLEDLLDWRHHGQGCKGNNGRPLSGRAAHRPTVPRGKRQLTEALSSGEWKPGDAIPAERRLAEHYGISIGTVRRAIDDLVAENMLIRQQGRGTFVASHNRDRLLFYFFHIVSQNGAKEYPVVRLLGFAKGKAALSEGFRSPSAIRFSAFVICCRFRPTSDRR